MSTAALETAIEAAWEARDQITPATQGETREAIDRRLDVARREMQSIEKYRHVVVNDNVDEAVAQLCDILKSYQDADDK